MEADFILLHIPRINKPVCIRLKSITHTLLAPIVDGSLCEQFAVLTAVAQTLSRHTVQAPAANWAEE
jgi:hypothetical protein